MLRRHELAQFWMVRSQRSQFLFLTSDIFDKFRPPVLREGLALHRPAGEVDRRRPLAPAVGQAGQGNPVSLKVGKGLTPQEQVLGQLGQMGGQADPLQGGALVKVRVPTGPPPPGL